MNDYETFASAGLKKKKTYGDNIEVEISFDGYLPPDEDGSNKIVEFENLFKVSWKISEKIRIYNMGEISKIKGESNYKAKIGIEYNL